MALALTGNSPRFDLFVSLAGPDRDDVLPIIKALDGEGLNLFVDERSVDVHDSITGRIREGLANSAALLAYYSRDYPTRLACQRELTAAFLAAKGSGQVAQRILVVNPESGEDHIEPVELRDLRFQRPSSGRELNRWAAAVAERINGLPGTLGLPGPLPHQPPWWPHWPVVSPFVGRYPELWKLHSALHAPDFPYVEHAGSVGLTVVHGLSGIGKTSLVEQYGIEFAAAFPGGVIWLHAAGGDNPVHDAADRLLVSYRSQLPDVAEWSDLPTRGVPPERLTWVLAEHLTRRAKPCLWVIDNVPAGMPVDAVRTMLVPSPYVRSVLTTRDSRYADLGVPVALGGLRPDEALELLDEQYEPAERAEALALAGDLGGHPFALRLAGSMLREARGLASVAEYRTRIHSDTSAVVADSLAGLDNAGRSVLQLAAVLATAPIPLRLLARAFAARHGFTGEQESDRLIEALRLPEQRCLTTRRNGAVVVHPLVLRAASGGDMRAAQSAVGAGLVDQVTGIDADPALGVHVRHLMDTGNPPDDVAIELLDWLAATDERAGAFLSAGRAGEQLVGRLHRRYGPGADRTVSAAIAAANAFVAAGAYASAVPLAQTAIDAGLGNRLAPAQHALATALDGLGRFTDAEPYWQAVVAALPGMDGATDVVRIDRARALRLRGHLDESMALLAEVPDDGPLERYVEQAVLHQMRGRPMQAKRAAERAVADYDEMGMQQHPAALQAAGVIVDANLQLAQRTPYPFPGGWQKALGRLKQICEQHERQYGPHSPLTLAAAVTYGVEVAGWHDSRAGKALLEAAERDARTWLGEQHPHRLRALYGLSSAAVLSGDFQAGLEFAKQAYEGQRRVLGENHPDTLFSLLQMGVARYLVHDDKAAVDAQRRAYDGLREVLGWLNHEVWRAWVSLRLGNVPAPVVRGAFRAGTAVVKGFSWIRAHVRGSTHHREPRDVTSDSD
jgi:tetratricopeptide (TPR) repeat protein